jgi:hypothetical protein
LFFIRQRRFTLNITKSNYFSFWVVSKCDISSIDFGNAWEKWVVSDHVSWANTIQNYSLYPLVPIYKNQNEVFGTHTFLGHLLLGVVPFRTNVTLLTLFTGGWTWGVEHFVIISSSLLHKFLFSQINLNHRIKLPK